MTAQYEKVVNSLLPSVGPMLPLRYRQALAAPEGDVVICAGVMGRQGGTEDVDEACREVCREEFKRSGGQKY